MKPIAGTPSNREIEALIGAYYAAFDNRGSRVPAAAALRAMFGEAATVTRMDRGIAETWTPEAFIEPRLALLTGGGLTEFHEWESAAQTIVLEAIASRWSTYHKAGTLNGSEFRGSGHKFIQLRREAGRWVISAILWEDI